jgi:hypothetical protein
MGDVLDIIASLIFLSLVAPKTVVISKFFSIYVPRGFLWKASIGSLVISLVTLIIIAIISIPLIVSIAYILSSSQWLQAVPFLIGYLVITISPGLFYERHVLIKSGVNKSIAMKVCAISNLYMLFVIFVLALSFYLIAMKFF